MTQARVFALHVAAAPASLESRCGWWASAVGCDHVLADPRAAQGDPRQPREVLSADAGARSASGWRARISAPSAARSSSTASCGGRGASASSELVRLEGIEHLQALEGKPVILFAPHFVGLDATLAAALARDADGHDVFAAEGPAVRARCCTRGARASAARMYPAPGGHQGGLQAIEAGERFYYLPDLDFGPKRSVFVPFFGVPAATTTGLSYIARTSGARRRALRDAMLPGGGYVARFYPAWSDFPSGDDDADTRRMMAFIEERVLEMPEQYLVAAQAVQDPPARRSEVLLKSRRWRSWRRPHGPLPRARSSRACAACRARRGGRRGRVARAPLSDRCRRSSALPGNPGPGRRRRDRRADRPAPRESRAPASSAGCTCWSRSRSRPTLAQADALVGLAKKRRVLQVGHVERYNARASRAIATRMSGRSTSTPSASPASSSAAPRSTWCSTS